jgi:hypothetical protein
LLHFGYVIQWEAFRGVVIYKQLFAHDRTSLARQLFFFTRFTTADSRHLWMLIKGYINKVCGETPSNLRMGVPVPTTNSVGLSVEVTKTQRKAAFKAPYMSNQDAGRFEDYLEMQPHRFVMLGINADSFNAVVWVMSQFVGPLNS